MTLSIPPGGALGTACDAALKHANRHRDELASSTSCGCFYCMRIFTFAAIVRWTDENQTARCPGCGVDAVLGDASGYPIDETFLRRMHRHWFTLVPQR